jgi:hypothetical protein
MKVYLVWELVWDMGDQSSEQVTHVTATEELANTFVAQSKASARVQGIEVEGAEHVAIFFNSVKLALLKEKSFDVTWGPDHGRPAGYYVSIPSYDGGTVVPLAEVEKLLSPKPDLPPQPIFHTDTNLRPEQVLPPGSPGSIRSY